METLVLGYLAATHIAAAIESPGGIDWVQTLVNAGVVGVVMALLLFTTKIRTGNDYDAMVAQYEARLVEKDDRIESQDEIIRQFQQATLYSQAAMAKSTRVIEALPDKAVAEVAVLDEVRATLARLEQLADPKGEGRS